MALVVLQPISTDKKRRSTSFQPDHKKPSPYRLKDYLLDDLSSCSSSGFRSFPRRGQCCAAAAALVLHNSTTRSNPASISSKRFSNKNNNHKTQQQVQHSNKSYPSKLFSSALQRASVAVINAVKLLPFKQTSTDPTTITKNPSSTAPQGTNKTDKKKSSSKRRSILPRGLSRRLFGKSATNDTPKSGGGGGDNDNRKQIERWITKSTEEEKYVPSDLSNTMSMVTRSSDSTTTSANSDRWSESDDHSEFARSGSSRSNSGENGVVLGTRGGRSDSLTGKEGRSFGITAGGEESAETASMTKQKDCWASQLELEEKEQLSPVSVLNFHDYDHEQQADAHIPSSPFAYRRLKSLNGTRKRLMKKLMRFDRLSNLDPMNLDSRLLHVAAEPANYHTGGNPTPSLPSPPSSPPPSSHRRTLIIKPEEAKERAELLRIFKARSRTKSSFNEAVTEEDLLREGGVWRPAGSRQQQSFLNWKTPAALYAKDVTIEKERSRDAVDDAEKEEVVVGLEVELLGTLIDELLEDMIMVGLV